MNIESLIYRYLSGTLSEAEEKKLLEWTGQSEDNRKEFYSMKALWNARNVYRYHSDLSGFASSMKNIDCRIAKATRHARLNRAAKAAAVIAGIAASIFIALILATDIEENIPPHENYITYDNTYSGSIAAYRLDDGTTVRMKGGSRLSVPETFGSVRTVVLEGEAYFDVAKDEASPFMVKTQGLTVQVLGTAFCVKAASDTDKIEVTLERGSIRLQTPEGMNLATLKPDQKAYYDISERNLEISQTDASKMILLEYDLVTLYDATLFQIISLIESEFNVRLSGPIKDIDRKYTFNYLRSNSLEDILKIIEFLTGNRYEVSGTGEQGI